MRLNASVVPSRLTAATDQLRGEKWQQREGRAAAENVAGPERESVSDPIQITVDPVVEHEEIFATMSGNPFRGAPRRYSLSSRRVPGPPLLHVAGMFERASPIADQR